MEDLNKIKDYIHGIIFKQKENKNENSANTGVEAGPGITAESAETAVADLRNRYSEKVRANFENTAASPRCTKSPDITQTTAVSSPKISRILLI